MSVHRHPWWPYVPQEGRNRLRRQKLPPDMAGEVAPKNILMIGPTGVGKTEVARRLAKLAGLPAFTRHTHTHTHTYTHTHTHTHRVPAMRLTCTLFLSHVLSFSFSFNGRRALRQGRSHQVH